MASWRYASCRRRSHGTMCFGLKLQRRDQQREPIARWDVTKLAKRNGAEGAVPSCECFLC
eukprot:14263515-Alexandrium_andersonii.AAC.1